VLESKIEKYNFGTYMESYTMPTLEIMMSPKESKSSIVCMKFSYRGDYLAVSFNNEYREEQKEQELNNTQNVSNVHLNSGGASKTNNTANMMN